MERTIKEAEMMKKTVASLLAFIIMGSIGLFTACNDNNGTSSSESGGNSLNSESVKDSVEDEEYSEEEMIGDTVDYAEMWRPQYHYSTKDSWVNDPNGLVYFKGVWHKYYQTNPHTNVGGNIHWGHATSTDLVHWEEHDYVLAPDSIGTMFSGTAVVDYFNTSGFFTDTEEKQGIVLAYSTSSQHVGIAYSLDDGYTFTKVSDTVPVLANPGVPDFRDPHVFWYPEGNKWIMVVAGGTVRIYESKNLLDWSLCSTGNINTECPSLLRMPLEGTNEEKWVLSCGGRGYYVGSFNGYKFTPETGYISMNEGPDAYAGITFANEPNNRVIMTSWLNNWAYTTADGKWNGAFTLPLEMKLIRVDNTYRLIQTPVKEVEALRGKELLAVENKKYANNVNPLEGIRSNSFELNAEIELSGSGNFALDFCVSETERTTILFNKDTMKMTVDRSASDYGIEAMKDRNYLYTFPIDPTSIENNVLKIRLFVDVSNMEMYINDGYYYFTARIQPFSSAKDMIFSYEGSLAFNKLTVHECKSIWFDEGEEISAIHVSDESEMYAIVAGAAIEREVYAFSTNGERKVKCRVLDESIASASVEGNTLKVTALKSGQTKVRLYSGKYYKDIDVIAYAEGEGQFRSTLGKLTTYGGTLKETPMAMEFDAGGGDAFALSEVFCKNVEISADITLLGTGAAALLVRAKDTSNFYCMNIDANAQVIKFWKRVNGNAATMREVQAELKTNVRYTLKVVVEGNSIKVYLNGELKLEATDNSLSEGYLGLNTFLSSAKFHTIEHTVLPDVS